MPRELSTAQARAILAQETEEVFLPLLTLSAGETFRIVNNTEPLVTVEGTHLPYPFEPEFPADSDERGGGVSVRIDNIDRDVTRLIRDFEGVPTATLSLVTASEPDTPVIGPCEFAVVSAEVDELQVTLQMGHEEDFLNQRVPAQTYSPTNSQGLYL
jgi:hypothetical protein